MISHKHKCIFIHIPKCAGTSIFNFFFPEVRTNWKVPDYEHLYGWCPKRKLHLQHATPKQLLETDLVDYKTWEAYFKFTIVRNPFDRSYSDYLWLQNDRKIKDSFENYILGKGKFKKVLTDNNTKNYRGDHLNKQVDYLFLNNSETMDFIGRFENLHNDIARVIDSLDVSRKFQNKSNINNNRYDHYSKFYNRKKRSLVERKYHDDLSFLDYTYEEKKNVIQQLYQTLR